MIAVALFLLKSGFILALVLMAVRLRWFSAAERHFLLAMAIASLPVMALASLLPDDLITVEPPQAVIDWEMEVALPEMPSQSTSSPTLAPGPDYGQLLLHAYWLIASLLIAVCILRLFWTRRLLGQTRVLMAEGRSLPIRQSDQIDTPMAWGAFAPEVVVPAAWQDWSPSKRRQVLAHEMAHVRRRDTLILLIGGLICALFWFQPLVWIAQRRMAVEAERACDDAVLSNGEDPAGYASVLLEIARASVNRPTQLAMASGMEMAARQTLPERVRALLHNETRRKTMTRNQILLGAMLSLSLLIPLGSVSATSADGYQLLSAEGDLLPIVKVAPVYPWQAKEDKLEGYVLVEFTVAPNGRVENAEVVQSEPAGVFDQAALDAVAKFRYKPRVEDGVAVASHGIRNRITFELPDDGATGASVVPNLDAPLMEKLQEVQDLTTAKDYAAAMETMNTLLADTSAYNGNERGQLYNMRAYVHFQLGEYAAAISDYEQVIGEREHIPAGLYTTTLYSLAQLSFVEQDYQSALGFMERWLAAAESPGPEPHIFSGQVYYQLQDFPAAIDHMERGIEVAERQNRTVKENWWALLNYLYYEQERWSDAVRVLEILQREYPNEKYDQRLDGIRKMLTDDSATG